MPEILVFCERDTLAFELLSKGGELAREPNARLAAAVLGRDAEARADEYLAYGADRAYVTEDTLLAEFYAESYAEALCQIVQGYGCEVVLLASTRRGKEMAPRLAQKLGCGCVTDAIDVRVSGGKLQMDRYTLGGNTVATEAIRTPRKVIAVMPRTFKPGERQPRQGEIVKVGLKLREPRVRIIEKRPKEGESVNLEAAETLVCVGRGLSKKEDLALVRQLAEALRAEIGCTRPLASEYQWLPEERLIGLSGKKCSPRLYVSLGISGQIQHTVGILRSKVIVAINKDKNAPIFKIADYGMVGDLYQVVPKLVERLKAAS